MWVPEYTAETAVSPEAIWAVLSDLDRWPRSGTSMERAALQGPFALGTGGTRITHRLEITGDGAAELGPQLGPEITADFPEAMDGLLACAAA
jgi:hypothetical protein